MSSVTLSGHLCIAWSNIAITFSVIVPIVTEGFGCVDYVVSMYGRNGDIKFGCPGIKFMFGCK
jgi:hypothetical protein